MRFSSPRIFWFVLVPASALLLAAWVWAGALARRDAALAREIEGLRAGLWAGGFEEKLERVRSREATVRHETAALRDFATNAERLGRDPLVRDHENLAFQLIEFERERASAAQAAREQATVAGVKLDASAFEVLADNSERPEQPRRRWAQLAVAREVAARAVAAKVGTYEALPVPAVREMRVDKTTPVLAEEILFSVRVTGESARVQDFIEYLALGAAPEDLRLVIEHLVLRKDGTASPDLASATVVVAGLLPPLPPLAAAPSP